MLERNSAYGHLTTYETLSFSEAQNQMIFYFAGNLSTEGKTCVRKLQGERIK